MRSSKFTFKITKRIVTVHKGVCLDLTEDEAKYLLALADWRSKHMPVSENHQVCMNLVKHLTEELS